jgi:cellulose biosynthesis protein BcsQ
MEISVSNKELADYIGKTEGAIRYMREKHPKDYHRLRKKYIKEQERKLKPKRPIVIMLYGFKGGIGKSSLSHIINENLSDKNSVLLNLDIARDIKEYTGLDAINFVDFIEEEQDISPSELIEELRKVSTHIIVDTPGESGCEYTLDAIKEVDMFVLPFGLDKEEKDMVETTLQSTLLDDMGLYPEEKELNLMFVLNNYKDDTDVEDGELFVEKMKELVSESECSYPKVNVFYSYLKYSKAINTMKKTRKSLSELSKENLVAYRFAKQRIKKFMKDMKAAIKTVRGE